MPSFEDVAGLLDQCTVAGPASDDMIASAGARLGAQFPRSYRTFLATHGAALCEGFEIAGLFHYADKSRPPLWSDVVASNLRIRHRNHLPEGYVAISSDGVEVTYYLDTANMRDDYECAVIGIGPGVDNVQVAVNFAEFLVRSFEQSLAF
jgi:SUKH superfamily protein